MPAVHARGGRRVAPTQRGRGAKGIMRWAWSLAAEGAADCPCSIPCLHCTPALRAPGAAARLRCREQRTAAPCWPLLAAQTLLIRRAALRCAALQAGDAEPFSAPEFYEQPEVEESQTWDAPAPMVPWSPPAVAAAAAAPEGTAAAAPGEGGGTEAAGAAGAPPAPAPPADPRLRYAAEYAALADWLRARPQQLPQFALPPAEPGEA